MKFLETIRIEPDGNIPLLPFHQQRVQNTWRAHHLQGEIPDLGNVVQHITTGMVMRCRMVYDDTNIHIEYAPYAKSPLRTLGLIESNISYESKFSDRHDLEKIRSLRGKLDDILIVRNGFITDITIANIVFFRDNTWLSPAKPLLAGTRLLSLVASHTVRLADISPGELESYQGWKPVNAMRPFDEEEIRPMSSIKNLVGI